MKRTLWILASLSIMISADEIKIAVAANVSYAMNALEVAFGKMHPETKLQVILGSSGKLTAQIKNGAPYDLFMAANMMYPKAVQKDGLTATKPRVYAQGSLALLSTKTLDFAKGMKLLESNAIKKIALANPKTAPYGKAAVEAMKNGGVYDKVQNKFVIAESISQTVTYVKTAADIGFVAKSSLYSPQMSGFEKTKQWNEVNSSLYTPIDQGIVILKKAEANKDVRAFYDFIFSKTAKDIFEAYGYIVP